MLDPGGGLLEAVEDLGQHLAEDLRGAPCRRRRHARRGCGRCRGSRRCRRDRRRLSRRRSSSWWRRRRIFSSAMSAVSSFVCASRSLRASISLERKSSTVSRSMASLSATAQKTLLRSCWLRARSSAASAVELLAGFGEVHVEHDVAARSRGRWSARPALKILVSSSVCEGCGCQNAGEHLGVEAVRVAGLGARCRCGCAPSRPRRESGCGSRRRRART